MKIVRMLKFEADDSQELRHLVEKCNMAASFFMDDRMGPEQDGDLKAVKVLCQGHPLELHHFDRAIDAVQKAQFRLNDTDPSGTFPVELKEQYLQNLKDARAILEEWKGAISDEGDAKSESD